MIHYDDYNLQLIEREIRYCYIRENYKQVECLLRVRKEMLNEQAMSHQKELLPDIIAFNDALRDALKVMYDRALCLTYGLPLSVTFVRPGLNSCALSIPNAGKSYTSNC